MNTMRMRLRRGSEALTACMESMGTSLLSDCRVLRLQGLKRMQNLQSFCRISDDHKRLNLNYAIDFKSFTKIFGGEGEIRTPDTLSGTLAFEASAFNHSATSPRAHSFIEAHHRRNRLVVVVRLEMSVPHGHRDVLMPEVLGHNCERNALHHPA